MNPDAARILADLNRHAACFDFTRDDLGEDLCKAATDAIAGGAEITVRLPRRSMVNTSWG